jgi:hypothetical protein
MAEDSEVGEKRNTPVVGIDVVGGEIDFGRPRHEPFKFTSFGVVTPSGAETEKVTGEN